MKCGPLKLRLYRHQSDGVVNRKDGPEKKLTDEYTPIKNKWQKGTNNVENHQFEKIQERSNEILDHIAFSNPRMDSEVSNCW